MKINNVDLYCACSNHVLNLSFRDPSASNPYNVKAIYGLDADEIVSNYYATGSVSENPFYNMSLKSRDVIVRIVLNPNYSIGETVSDLRDNLYRAISTNRAGQVSLRFKDDGVEQASISGFVSKFEAAHFSDTPEIQLTVSCMNPMLKAPNAEIINGADLHSSTPTFNDLVSTAPHGCEMVFTFTESTTLFELKDANVPDWSFKVAPPVILTDFEFYAGDDLHISSVDKKKNVKLFRGGPLALQLADKVIPNSVWPTVFPGENKFVLGDPTKYQLSTLSHHHTFWGV